MSSLRRAVPAAVLAALAFASSAEALIIGEFRVRGPNGANDEFVELYNDRDEAVTVATTDGSAGWAVAAATGVRFVVPNGTVIPPGGHYLGVNTTGYSLAAMATGDATWTTDIPDNAGIALFRTATPANFSLATRLDAAGSTAEGNGLYKEGAGYPALTPFSIDYAFQRDLRGGGYALDTGDNANDLRFVDTNGTSAGAGQNLGAPSPHNLAAPLTARAPNAEILPLDPAAALTAPPNQVYDSTSIPVQNATFGRIFLRRTFRNRGSQPVTALRLQIADIATFPSPSGIADLRPDTTATTRTVATSAGDVNVVGTLLLEPPSQPNGTGFHGVLVVSLPAPVQPNDVVSFEISIGVQQHGEFRFCAHAEGTPAVAATLSTVGNTVDGGRVPAPRCGDTPGFLGPGGPQLVYETKVQTQTVTVPEHRAAPAVALELVRSSTKRRLRVRVTCPSSLRGACSGRVSATAKAGKRAVKMGSATMSLAPGAATTYRLRPTAAARRALRKVRRARVTITAVTLGDGGTTRKTTATARLRR